MVSVLVLALGAGQLLLGSSRTGVTTDEPFHVLRLQSWLDGDEYVPPLLNDLPGTYGSEYVYGPSFAVFAHGINVVTGQEPWKSVSSENTPTVVRHLSSAFLALLAAIAAGFAVAAVTGSRLLGLWTSAALLAIPLWTGMGFFNPKDTPVAAGFTFFTAALILSQRVGASKRAGGQILIGGMAAAGVFFSVGTRLAMWLPLVLSLVVFGCLAFQARRSGGCYDWPAVAIGGALGLAGVIALYPSVFAQPIEFVTNSLGSSSDYDWMGFTLTAGQLLPEHPPWWYLPVWGFASTPVLIGLIALTGLAGPLRSLWQRFRSGTLLDGPPGPREAAVIIIGAQLLILPLGSMVMGSTMYNGLRQHLYVMPAVAMLAGIGASYLVAWVRRAESPIRAWLVTGGLALALAVPMAEQLMIFPYNYIYVNPVAGIGGVSDRWEGDYWAAGLKEGSERVPDGQTAYCGGVTNEGIDQYTFLPCADELRPYALPNPQTRTGEPGRRWSLLARRGGARLPETCTPEENVTRWLRGETIVVSFVARC